MKLFHFRSLWFVAVCILPCSAVFGAQMQQGVASIQALFDSNYKNVIESKNSKGNSFLNGVGITGNAAWDNITSSARQDAKEQTQETELDERAQEKTRSKLEKAAAKDQATEEKENTEKKAKKEVDNTTDPEKQKAADEAQEKYDAAKENEQSLANRTLTGATMAATGIGGMELARGLAEQKADKAADADMTAYLSTFQCKVGDKRYTGGDSQIEIPGGNELINLYQEYVNLANSLKERKAALGKKAGIESEVILDKANMGLYDETGKGIENGTYASLYRAARGNENDAAKTQEQKDASKKRVIAGAVVAGAGVVGGTIGNLAINGKKEAAEAGEKAEADQTVNDAFNNLIQGNKNNPLY